MKKTITISVTMAMAGILLTGCANGLKLKTNKKITAEYGEKLNNDLLYVKKDSDASVSVKEIKGFDNKVMKEQQITVTFANKDGKEKTEKITVIMKDTKPAKIELKKEKITITVGDKVDLQANVKSVEDPIDGKLKYSKQEVKKNGYFIDKGKLDIKKAGSYEVKIKAADKNGNTSEKTFKVIVEKKKEVSKKPENSDKGSQKSQNTASSNTPSQNIQGTPPASNNNNGGDTSGNTQGNKPSKPESNPTPAPVQPYIIDDGRKMGLPISMQSPLFDNPEQASAWAEEIMDKSEVDSNHPYYNCNGWSGTGVKFSDGSIKYSIYWGTLN